MLSGGNRKAVSLLVCVWCWFHLSSRGWCVWWIRIRVWCVVSCSPAFPLGWSLGGCQSGHCCDYLYLAILSSVRSPLSLGAWTGTLWVNPSLQIPVGIHPDLTFIFLKDSLCFWVLSRQSLRCPDGKGICRTLRSKWCLQRDVGTSAQQKLCEQLPFTPGRVHIPPGMKLTQCIEPSS